MQLKYGRGCGPALWDPVMNGTAASMWAEGTVLSTAIHSTAAQVQVLGCSRREAAKQTLTHTAPAESFLLPSLLSQWMVLLPWGDGEKPGKMAGGRIKVEEQ